MAILGLESADMFPLTVGLVAGVATMSTATILSSRTEGPGWWLRTSLMAAGVVAAWHFGRSPSPVDQYTVDDGMTARRPGAMSVTRVRARHL